MHSKAVLVWVYICCNKDTYTRTRMHVCTHAHAHTHTRTRTRTHIPNSIIAFLHLLLRYVLTTQIILIPLVPLTALTTLMNLKPLETELQAQTSLEKKFNNYNLGCNRLKKMKRIHVWLAVVLFRVLQALTVQVVCVLSVYVYLVYVCIVCVLSMCV